MKKMVLIRTLRDVTMFGVACEEEVYFLGVVVSESEYTFQSTLTELTPSEVDFYEHFITTWYADYGFTVVDEEELVIYKINDR